MRDIFVTPGVNVLQSALNSAPASGARLVLREGTFSASAIAAIMDFRAAATGKTFTNLIIEGAGPGKTFIDVSGCTASPFYVCGASVRWAGLTLIGTPINDLLMFNDSAVNTTAATGWIWEDMALGCGRVVWYLVNPGLSMIIRRIETLPTFSGYAPFDIRGNSQTRIDLNINNIDVRKHAAGTLQYGGRLQDIWDARVRAFDGSDMTVDGLDIQSSSDALQCRYVMISKARFWRPGSTGIHIGNTATVAHTQWCDMDDIEVYDSLFYALEYENLVTDCVLSNFKAIRSRSLGIALAEDTERITVRNGLVDGVANFGHMSCLTTAVGRDHKIEHNTFANAKYAITISEPAGFSVPSEKILIRHNDIVGVDFAYRLTASAMKTGVLAHRIGPNKITRPRIGYATVDGNTPKTQAETLALFPDCFDEPDEIVSASDTRYMDSKNGDYRIRGGVVAERIGAGYSAPAPFRSS